MALWGHTLNPLNGLLGIPLAPFLSLVEIHNAIVAFAFVAGGVSAFLLARELAGGTGASLLAGFVFTFSSYHFAHAQGHLQLVSLEWIPLFLLCWWRFLRRPGARIALGSAGALLLVLLCDHYYFGFCLLAAAVLSAWVLVRAWRRGARPPGFGRPLALFALAAGASCGPIVGSLLASNAGDPFLGGHEPREFSLDLLAPIVPGAHWRFAALTEPVWSRLRAGPHESSVHLGLAVLLLLAYAVWHRRSLDLRGAAAWWAIALVALVLALGPSLQVGGRELVSGLLPYAALERIFPPLRLAGTPVRLMVLVQLSAALIAAAAFRHLWARGRRGRIAGIALLALLLFEYLPGPLPRTPPEIPAHVRALRSLPSDGAVLDLVAGPGEALYHQTHHGKPLAFGYISRLPGSVVRRLERMTASLSAGDVGTLCREFALRYLVVAPPAEDRLTALGEAVYADGQAAIVRLRCPP